jgi:hypothetical protein
MIMVDKAKEELKYLREDNNEPDEMQDWVEKNIIEIIEVFAKQGHSGSSAEYCIPIINRLLRQEPISPLTGNDNEWAEVSEGVYQNKRMSSVFKDKNQFSGQAYWLDGKMFSDNGGKTWYTNRDSWVTIEFPWNKPKSEYIILEDK